MANASIVEDDGLRSFEGEQILVAGRWSAPHRGRRGRRQRAFGIARLTRADLPRFARLSAVLAALAWIGAACNVVGLGLARDATLGVVFLLWAAWSIWLASLLWRPAAAVRLAADDSPHADRDVNGLGPARHLWSDPGGHRMAW